MDLLPHRSTWPMTCAHCGEVKTASDFYIKRYSSDGHGGYWCKTCYDQRPGGHGFPIRLDTA